MRRKISSVLLCVVMVAIAFGTLSTQTATGYNTSTHITLHELSVEYLNEAGHNDVYGFFTGNNPDNVDIRDLWFQHDDGWVHEIMWPDIHSTTTADENAFDNFRADFFAYYWGSGNRLSDDPGAITHIQECPVTVPPEHLNVWKAAQETFYDPTLGPNRAIYDLCTDFPVGLLYLSDCPTCQDIGLNYGVFGQNSLRDKITIHNAKFKALEYTNYAVGEYKAGNIEQSFRWLTRLMNYVQHAGVPYKTRWPDENWPDNYGDAVSRMLIEHELGTLYLDYCDLADAEFSSITWPDPTSFVESTEPIIDVVAILMDELAWEAHGKFNLVDDASDYPDNALSALVQLLPFTRNVSAEILYNFYMKVGPISPIVSPSFVIIDVHGPPSSEFTQVYYAIDGIGVAQPFHLYGGNFVWFAFSDELVITVDRTIPPPPHPDQDLLPPYYLLTGIIVSFGGPFGMITMEPTVRFTGCATAHVLYRYIEEAMAILGPPPPPIDIDPNTLNFKSKGKWITCYIELPESYDVANIVVSIILLEDALPPELNPKYGFVTDPDSYIMDHDNDGIMERMVKFDRSEVEDMLSPGTYNLKVTGELADGTVFEGYSDEIRMIEPP